MSICDLIKGWFNKTPKLKVGEYKFNVDAPQCDEWSYSTKVKCPQLESGYTVFIQGNVLADKVDYKCICGEVIQLHTTPVKEVFIISGTIMETITGSCVQMTTGAYGFHVVGAMFEIKPVEVVE